MIRTTTSDLTPWLLAGAVLLGAGGAAAGELRVRISGIQEEKGTVRVALFRSASDYDGDHQSAGYFEVARKSGVEAVFAGLPPGRYGVSSFHDVDGDEDLDTNLVGIPNEPFGFSRNARGRFGPPTFDDIAVDVGDGPVTIDVEIQ